jgi:hypothetical protein
MASYTARNVIKQYLNAEWTTTPIVYQNPRHNIPSGDPAAFLVVQVRGIFEDQASIGAETRLANLWREEGELYLNVYVPSGSGDDTAAQHCETLMGLFKGQEIGGIIFRGGTIGEDEDAPDIEGNYYSMTATIFWYRDHNS